MKLNLAVFTHFRAQKFKIDSNKTTLHMPSPIFAITVICRNFFTEYSGNVPGSVLQSPVFRQLGITE